MRLADMLGYYGQGGADLAPRAAERRPRGRAGRHRAAAGDVRAAPPQQARQRAIDPCPLSDRELEVLQRLAQGKVYKQIATEL